MAKQNCSESIVMDSYFDTQNIVADIQCSVVSEFGVSNNLNLTATFPYTPNNGKIILGSGLKLRATYLFPQTQYQHTTSLWINNIFIMNLPLLKDDTRCSYPTTYSLDSNNLALTSYLDLGVSNTLKISTIMPSPTSSIYLTKVSLSYCFVPYDTTIVDLAVSSSVSSIKFLTPLSYSQVKSEPFTGLFVNNLTDSASLPIVINNKAVDPAVNITVTISSSALYPISIISLQNIRKISTSNILIISPEIQNSSDSNSISFTLYNVNLSHLESLAFDVNFQLNGTKSEKTISSSSIQISVDSSNEFVEEINTSDNSKSFTFSLFQTKSVLSNVETSLNPSMSSSNMVSELAYFIHQPQSPFTQNCWFQVNLITSSAFSGTLYIISNRTMEQRKISFAVTDFIGTILFLAIPPEQLDCSGSNTLIYARVEASTASFKFYLSRKFYSTMNDDNLTLNSVYTQKTLSGEAFGVTFSPVTKLEQLPLLTNLTFFNDGSSVDKFLSFNTMKSTSIELFSKAKGTSVPKNQFPNIPLSSSNVLYYFETTCSSCTVNLALTYPSIYSNPPIATLKTTGYQYQLKSLASNGVHWFFLDASKVSSDTVRIFVLATVSGLSSSYQPSKLSLIATQDFIDNSINSNGALTRSLQSTVLYNQTLNCNNYTYIYPYQPKISILSPSLRTKGSIWKYGLSIDPSIQYTQITFSYLATNYSNSIYSTKTTNYISTLSGDFYYTLNFDYSYANASDLTINFDNYLKIYDRSYVIYSRIGQLPTVSDYDMKTPEISFYNTTAKTYSLRYFFSDRGTFTFQDSISRLVSSSKLNQRGQKIYLYFREVPGSVVLNSYSCYLDSSNIYFQHTYTSSVLFNSESTVYLSYPNLIINASNLNISQSSIDGYVNVEFTTTYTLSSGEIVYMIDWNTNEFIPMNKTTFAYTTYYNYYDEDTAPTKYQSILTKLNARIKITQAVVDSKGNLFISLIFPSTTYTKYTSNYAYVFVEEQVPAQPQTLSILIALGVMGGLFILCTVYLFICFFVIWSKASTDTAVAANYDASVKAFAKRPAFLIFLDLALLMIPVVSGISETITKKKIHSIIAMTILGFVCLFCSIAFYIGLLVPMGVYMNTLLNSESEIIPKRAQLPNYSYYTCCKYRPAASISTYANVMDTQDRTLSCMKSSSSNLAYNLAINGVMYQPSSPLSSNFTNGGASAVAFGKIQCPNSEIIFLDAGFDSIEALGIAGLVLGTSFLFLSVLYFTTCLTDYLIKKAITDKWVFKSIFSTRSARNHHANITNSNASTAHSDDSHNIQIVVDNSESLRREQEEMARIDREDRLRREREARNKLLEEESMRREREEMARIDKEERARKEREANIPPEVKLPPPKPNQPTQVELNEIDRTTNAPSAPPVVDNQSSNMFVYDNTQGNFINPTQSVYNPYENTDDIVVVYQRTDNKNPPTQ